MRAYATCRRVIAEGLRVPPAPQHHGPWVHRRGPKRVRAGRGAQDKASQALASDAGERGAWWVGVALYSSQARLKRGCSALGFFPLVDN